MLFLAAAITTANSIQAPVNLGTAGNFAILAQSGLTTTGTTKIVGDLGVSPAGAATITGFAETADSAGAYSSSGLVTGKIYAASYSPPTPAMLTQAISDKQTAYDDASGRTNPDKLNYGINGPSTLNEGLYKWTAALSVDGEITLAGNSSSVYVFQVDGTLDFLATSNINLGNVSPSNVVWQASGGVTLAAGSKVQGIILGKTGIVFNTGAQLVKGRALAGTAVTLISNTITQP